MSREQIRFGISTGLVVFGLGGLATALVAYGTLITRMDQFRSELNRALNDHDAVVSLQVRVSDLEMKVKVQ